MRLIQYKIISQTREFKPLQWINDAQVPYTSSAEHLGITFDTKLRWKFHRKKGTRYQLQENVLLIGKNSAFSIYNELLLYKQIQRPIWSYGC